MAPKKALSSSSPITIGNCDVLVESNKFTLKSDPNTLQISVNRSAKIKISVREEHNRSNNDICQLKAAGDGEGRTSTFKDDYTFVLVNSKDSNSCSKSYLQEVLKLYTRELPTMNYAANTGKQSMFLEKCVSNGKYSSLLLENKAVEGSGEIIAAITYQIVPADTQHAEIPLAAVRSIYQRKGFGRFLYMELRKRLWNVGIHAIYCWGDKESEGFWLKQGFESIAEIDKKCRARRLPIKPHIQRSLCFPGGSILMVSHLNPNTSADSVKPLESNFPPKLLKESSSVVNVSIQPSGSYNALNSENQIISKKISDPGLIRDGFSGEHKTVEGFSLDRNCEDLASLDGKQYSKKMAGAELEKFGVDVDVKYCSCCTQGTKKRCWEASLSSLKSKKVKGSHQIDCGTESVTDIDPESERTDPCFNRCSLGISKFNFSEGVTLKVPCTSNCMENNAKEGGSMYVASEAVVSKEHQSKMSCVRIMLMNIADDTKKIHLIKVIESLGGAVTSDGSVSTHVVTGKVRKTLNFCTALCSGAWIVSSSWLKESSKNGKFVDEFPHVLYDEEYELKYRIKLKDAVSRAKAIPGALLKGYNICIAAHVQPPVGTLSAIVRSAGGNIIRGLDKETVNEESNTIFIACEEDMEEALSAAKKGIKTFSSDWLMNCIMTQELDLQALQFAESL